MRELTSPTLDIHPTQDQVVLETMHDLITLKLRIGMTTEIVLLWWVAFQPAARDSALQATAPCCLNAAQRC